MGIFTFFGKKVNNAIEIADDTLKIIQAEGPKKIAKISVRPLPAESDELKSAAIRQALSELNIKPANFVSSIPRNLTTIRNLRLPSVKDSEIESMVEFQATKQIPYSKEEIIIDYQIKSKDKDGFSDVMLVIVHQNIINKLLEVLRQADIEPAKVCLGSEGILNWYRIARKKQEEQADIATALLDLDTNWINFEIVLKDMLLFSRSFSIGKLPRLLEAEDSQKEAFQFWQDRLIEEVRRTYATYKSEKLGPRFGKLVLVGEEKTAKELSQKIETEFNVPVEIYEPFENLIVEENIKKGEILQQNISITSCLGIALAPASNRIDLLPAKLRRDRELQKKKKSLLLAVFLSLFSFLLAGSLFAKEIYDKKKLAAELEERIKITQSNADALEDMSEKTKLIKKQLDFRGSCLDILYEIYNIVPAQVSIMILTFDEDKLVTLRGSSKNMNDVFNLVDTLEKSDYFQGVEVRYASKRKVKGIELTDFQIQCPLTKLISK